jgi:hypothetical protein
MQWTSVSGGQDVIRLPRYQKALAELKRVIDLEHDHERALLWQCRSMRRLGQWSKLETHLDNKIAGFERSARLRIELGWLRLAQGESRKADEAFQERVPA